MRVLLCGVKGGEFAVREGSFVRPRLAVSSAAIAGFIALLVFAGSGGASGAATAKAQKVTRIDVSTRAAVIHYLRSIDVNPKGAVIQRGLRNYAGAHCPGKHWTCAGTRHTVVQIARRGGQNRFMCRSSKCVVVQLAGVSHGVYIASRSLASTAAPAGKGNSAVCIKMGSGATTGSGQSCVISQSGSGPNTAVVYENTMKVSGLTQSAQYTALITQVVSSGSNGNTACVTQNINLDGSASNTNGKLTTADLKAHQSVTINQDAVGGGANTATNAAALSGSTAICDTNNTLAQTQTLTSTITATGPITQNQDAAFSPCGDGRTGEYANLCLDIEQNQGTANGVATGTNNASFTQNSTQTAIAHTTKGPVNQTQSTPLCSSGPAGCVFPGGLVGTLNQDSHGRSIASATQNETQCEDAATSGPLTCSTTPDSPGIPNGLTQKQYGPVGVGNVRHNHRGHRRVLFSHGKGLGQSIQTGNDGCTPGNCNSFTVSQQSTQNADTNATQVNLGVADCGTTGSCSASQTTTVNGSPTSDGYTAPVIGNLVINCPTGQTCAGTPPPAPQITGHPDAQTTSTSATFTWTEAATGGVTLKCSIDGGTFSTCDSPTSTSYTGLSHGPHTFEVKAVDNTASHNSSAADSFSWEIIPYLTFEKTDDGAAAGWSGTPGWPPITLTTGSDPGTYAQFTIHDSNSLLVDDLAEPTFTTDTFTGGAPRYEIDFSNGDYAFGYPTQQGWDPDSWDLNCGHVGCLPMSHVSWSAIKSAETGETVTDALIDADFPANATYNIIDFTFDSYSLSFFTD
jgi:hypothetical protein